MVLKLIIIIGLILIWLVISPMFNAIGRFFTKWFERVFKNDEGENKNE